MSIPTRQIPPQDLLPDFGPRQEKLDAIFAKGNVAKFTNVLNGVIKYVKDGTQDVDGDLSAYFTTGRGIFVNPRLSQYGLEELTEAEAEHAIKRHI